MFCVFCMIFGTILNSGHEKWADTFRLLGGKPFGNAFIGIQGVTSNNGIPYECMSMLTV